VTIELYRDITATVKVLVGVNAAPEAPAAPEADEAPEAAETTEAAE